MSLSCTTVEWRGVTFSSDLSSPYGIRTLMGWDERPDTRRDAPDRPGQHGRFAGSVTSDERVVTLGGQLLSQDRDALLHALDAEMTLSPPYAPPEVLTVTRAGRTLTAGARLTAFKTPTDLDWSMGLVPFAVEWRCPDPFRYGPTVEQVTGFARDMSGLRFPLFSEGGVLTFGSPGSETGTVWVSNVGTADAWPVFTVAGPVTDDGFELIDVEGGSVLRFAGGVPTGESLVIDAAQGLVTLAGGDRRQSLTVRQWWSVPPGETRTARFRPLGSATSAQVTVALRSTYW